MRLRGGSLTCRGLHGRNWHRREGGARYRFFGYLGWYFIVNVNSIRHGRPSSVHYERHGPLNMETSGEEAAAIWHGLVIASHCTLEESHPYSLGVRFRSTIKLQTY